MNFEIPDSVVDMIIKSLENHPERWTYRGDLLINSMGVIIGNFDLPNALIVHGDRLKFGVTKNTISLENAQKISNSACNLVSSIFNQQITSLAESIK